MRSTRWPSPRSRTHPKNDGGPVASLRLGPPAVIWRRLCLPVCAVSEQPDLATQTGQVQDKFTAQTGQVRDKFHTQNPNITQEFGKGYGERNLSYFRQLFLSFDDLEILHTRVQNLTWFHLKQVLSFYNTIEFFGVPRFSRKRRFLVPALK